MPDMYDYLSDCLKRYPQLAACEDDIKCACDLIANSFRNECKLLICGNGGSASDSGHMAGELLKSFRVQRKVDEKIKKVIGDNVADNLQGALPAISLPDMVAINTAYANDCNPQYCFAQLTYGLGKNKDTLLCISTSGNAKNVILAAIVAKAKNMNVIGLTGETGGNLAQHCDICIKAPESETFKIQELHLPIYHTLCLMLEQIFFG
ncbi:MAG: SIS domain-containing protein [Puniceicoccales bacterium]|jgi:D-sedoheptulose 7-phosphate isomerase|nr:SIS domain-containing protein [Puniceicoccales bacterium]